jgi:hypothetical protein
MKSTKTLFFVYLIMSDYDPVFPGYIDPII